MTNQRIETGLRVSWHIAQKAYTVAKVTILVSIAAFALIGAYVVSQPALRDAAIDHAQGQGHTMAEAPKGN